MENSSPNSEALQDNPDSEEISQNLIFVGGLPLDADEDDLWHYFSSFGTVLSVEIRRSVKGKSKGFGFIRFRNFQDLKLVMAQKSHMILKTSINVEQAQDTQTKKKEQDSRKDRKIIVGNIPSGRTLDDIKVQLLIIGPVEKITQLRSRNDGTFYCHVIMANQVDADRLLLMKKHKTEYGFYLKFKPYQVNSSTESEQNLGGGFKVHELAQVKKQSAASHLSNERVVEMTANQPKQHLIIQEKYIPSPGQHMEALENGTKPFEISRNDLRIRKNLTIKGLPVARRSGRRTCSLDFQRIEQSPSSSPTPRSHSSEESAYRFNISRTQRPSGLQ
jgi:RNA recognition motif-containing protein